MSSNSYFKNILQNLDGNIVILNQKGLIEFVNDNWLSFAKENGISPNYNWIGVDYVSFCTVSSGQDDRCAKEAYDGLINILNSESDFFELEYPCHSAHKDRWFKMSATKFEFDGKSGITIIHKDITELRKAENKLKESQSRLKETETMAHIGSWYWDLENDQLYGSEVVYDIFGLPLNAKVNYRALIYLIHSDDQKLLRLNIDYWLQNKEGKPFEYRIVRPDGVERNIYGTGTVTCNEKGKPILLSGKLQDITDFKQTSLKLSYTEQRLEGIVNSISDFMYIIDQDYKIIWTNDVTRNFFSDSIHNSSCFSCIRGKTSACSDCSVTATFKDGKSHEHTKEILKKDGEKRIFWSTSNVSSFDENGKPLRVVVISRDITDKVRTEREKEKFFELSSDLIAIGNFEGYFTYLNPVWNEVLGFDLQEMKKEPFFHFVHPDDLDATRAEFNKLLGGQKVLYFENRYRTKAGEYRNLEWSATPLIENETVYCIARDVTEHKKAEDSLKQSEKDFRDLVEQNPLYIEIYNPDGKLVHLNNSYRSLLEINDELTQVLYDNYNLLEDPNAATHGLMPGIIHILSGEHFSFHEFEFDIDQIRDLLGQQNKNKGKIWLKSTGFPTKDVNGDVKQLVFLSQDVSQWVTAEKELQSARIFTDKLVQSANVMIIGLDDQGSINIFNPAAERITGYSIEELKGQNWFEKLTPINKYPDVYREFERYKKNKGLGNFENPILTKNGEERYISWSNNTLTENGEFRGTISFGQDITQNILSKEKLKISEERYRTLFSGSSNGILFADTKTRKFKFANPAIAKMLGYTQNELCNMGVENIHPPNSLELVMQEFQDQLEGKSHFARALPCLRKDGAIIYANISTSLLKTSEGEFSVGFFTDVTEYTKAEMALIDSENKFRALFNTGGYAMSLAKATDGIAVMVNQAWLDMFGYSNQEDVVGKNVTASIAPKEHEKLREIMHLHSLGKAPSIYNTVGLRKDGSSFDMEMRVTQFDMQGEKYSLAMMNDITARLEAERKIRISEENYRMLIEQANDGVVVIQNGTLRFVNTALTKITGYSTQELLNSHFLDLIEPGELDKVKANYAKRMKGDPVPPYESKIIRKDGEIREVEFNGGLTSYEGGIADLAMVRDITERKKAIETRDKLFNLSQDLIAVASLENTKFIYVNEAWHSELGYRSDELIGISILEHIHPNDHKKTHVEINRLKLGKNTIDFEDRFFNKNGDIKSYSWTATPLIEDGLFYAIGRDITEQKKVEAQIIQYQGRLKDQALELTLTEERQRKQIATDLHDQVGQLLASSRLQLATLTPKLEKEVILDRAKEISKGLLSAISSTRNLIFDLSPPQLNEIGLFAAVADWLEEQVEQKTAIKTNITGRDEKYPIDENVRVLLFRNVRELLVNIIKHSKASFAEVIITYATPKLTISVSDDGIGFNYSPEMLKLRNSGFGLFSIMERMNDMGGEMEIETAPNFGTKITLTIST